MEKAKEIKRFVDERYALTAASFDDPIALKTEWRPEKKGGSNFETHSLININENRLEFKATTGAKLFYLVFAAISLGFIFLIIIIPTENSFSVNLILFLLALICSLISFTLFYFGTKPIVFDRKKGCFWNGRKPPRTRSNYSISKKFAFFEQIHALQLISETCQSSSSSTSNRSFESYELNLVLKNGQRINVVDHGNKQTLRKDATTLAQFLDKPIWDAI
jgi:hypothetical protein